MPRACSPTPSGRSPPSAASRPAIWPPASAPKEAVAKALALTDGDWHEVEVLGGGHAAPSVRLSGRAAERAGELGVEVEISLTHSKGMAGAVAVLR